MGFAALIASSIVGLTTIGIMAPASVSATTTTTAAAAPALMPTVTATATSTSSKGDFYTGDPATLTAVVRSPNSCPTDADCDTSYPGPTGSVMFASVDATPALSCTATLTPDNFGYAAGACLVTPEVTGALSFSGNYSGDTTFSSATTSQNLTFQVAAGFDPRISAQARSHSRKTKFGWYRDPVTVEFTCMSGSAPLAKACPGPVILNTSVAAVTIRRSISDTDGRKASVTTGPFRIDRVAPTVRLRENHQHEVICTGSDGLSGIARLTCTHKKAGKNIRWTARAVDKAGNVRTRSLIVKPYRVAKH